MKTTRLLLPALAVMLIGLLACPVRAGGQAPVAEQQAPDRAEVLAGQAGRRVQSFASYVDGHLGRTARAGALGWPAFTVLLLVGALAMFFGWAFVRSLLVPCAPVLGLATGGFMAFSLVEALYADRPGWFRWTLLGGGAVLGAGAYLLSALKAKPVAAFLVVLCPFLILSAFLFPYSGGMGLLLFCVGFLAGFAAMVDVRPVAIIATCILGGTFVLAAWGLLSHLLGEIAFLRAFFEWLLANPLMLAVALAALIFIGSSFQFATAPRGGLEG